MMYGAIRKTLSVDDEANPRGRVNDSDDFNSQETSLVDASNRYIRLNPPKQFSTSMKIFVVSCSAILIALIALGASYLTTSTYEQYNDDIPNDFVKMSFNETKYFSTDDLYIESSNEYGVFSAPYPWMDDVDGTMFVEPYKKSTLIISGDYLDEDKYYYFWTIEGKNSEYSGSSLELTLTHTGYFDLNVEIYTQDSGEYVGTYYTKVVCKYVKRELRTLTEADRDAFLDAAAEIWAYSTTEGREVYGDKFTSIDTFVAEHSLASNNVMCDSFHEGSGFLTHHLAIQNSFEAALRTIDPSVTLPYWDFTIEGQQILDLDELPSYLLEISPVFTDTWFGSVDDDNHIQDSRWAHSHMPVQEDTDSGTRNSYGYIRSYWNNNPDSEVARRMFDACGLEPKHKYIPYCKLHYDVLNAKDLAALQLLSPSDGHGPMHVQIGGMWGQCEDAYANFTSKWADKLDEAIDLDDVTPYGYDDKSWKWGYDTPRRDMFEKAVMGEYFHIYRSFWRSHMCAVDDTPNLLVCPDECDLDVPFEECTCTVPTLLSGETTWENLFPCVLNSETNQNAFNAIYPTEMIKDMVTFMATTPLLEGEMIESASTADIMFWLIHPCIERMVSAKRLPGVTSMGGTDFSKWDDVAGNNQTFLEYSYYTLLEGENAYYPDAYTCVGHAADDTVLPDMLPLTDALREVADADGDGRVSNWEFWLAIDPNEISNQDYVFDNFDWDHCEGKL